MSVRAHDLQHTAQEFDCLPHVARALSLVLLLHIGGCSVDPPSTAKAADLGSLTDVSRALSLVLLLHMPCRSLVLQV